MPNIIQLIKCLETRDERNTFVKLIAELPLSLYNHRISSQIRTFAIGFIGSLDNTLCNCDFIIQNWSYLHTHDIALIKENSIEKLFNEINGNLDSNLIEEFVIACAYSIKQNIPVSLNKIQLVHQLIEYLFSSQCQSENHPIIKKFNILSVCMTIMDESLLNLCYSICGSFISTDDNEIVWKILVKDCINQTRLESLINSMRYFFELHTNTSCSTSEKSILNTLQAFSFILCDACTAQQLSTCPSCSTISDCIINFLEINHHLLDNQSQQSIRYSALNCCSKAYYHSSGLDKYAIADSVLFESIFNCLISSINSIGEAAL